MSTKTMSDAELEALRSRLATLEQERKGRAQMSVREFQERLAEADLRKLLERRERDRLRAEATTDEQGAVEKERGKLTARLHAVESDRAERLAQHERSREKILADFDRQAAAVLAARDQLDREVAGRVTERLAGTVIDVGKLKLPPPGADTSSLRVDTNLQERWRPAGVR